MEYEKILRECCDPQIGEAVLNALRKLFEKDLHLLVVDSSEQSIAAKIANHLEPYFNDRHIDVEYDRIGIDIKKVSWTGPPPSKVYPDIIVHLRGDKDNNLLAIELKKSSNNKKKDEDICKLRAYRNQLGYKHTLFIRLCVKNKAGEVKECEWVTSINSNNLKANDAI